MTALTPLAPSSTAPLVVPGRHLIGPEWVPGAGTPLESHDPATGELLWEGKSATEREVDSAVRKARAALDDWAFRPLADRVRVLEAFAEQLKSRRNDLAETISRE